MQTRLVERKGENHEPAFLEETSEVETLCRLFVDLTANRERQYFHCLADLSFHIVKCSRTDRVTSQKSICCFLGSLLGLIHFIKDSVHRSALD